MSKQFKGIPKLEKMFSRSTKVQKQLLKYRWLRVVESQLLGLIDELFIALLANLLRSLAGYTSNSKLIRPPGEILLTISEFAFKKQFFERVIMRTIFDMREEYFEALSQNRIWKARWVRIRGTWSFFAAMGLDRAFAFVSFFVKAWKSVN